MNGNWYYRYELVVKIKWMLGKRVSKIEWWGGSVLVMKVNGLPQKVGKHA